MPRHPARRNYDSDGREQLRMIRHANVRLAALEQPTYAGSDDHDLLDIADDLLRRYREQRRMLPHQACAPDRRIQSFLNAFFCENGMRRSVTLPADTLVLDRPGLARELSLPPDGHHFANSRLDSYRIAQGVLHNPRSDRRTTKGSFHVVANGLPIPGDKRSVPVHVFAALLDAALRPPEDLLRLPFTAGQPREASLWVSLYLRPRVRPAVPGVAPGARMETRFFAPGGFVANLDFVERIFGNGGDPFLPEYDAELDAETWCGTTGCIILAPHLMHLRKQDLGLPHVDKATPRQRRDGMCWQDPEERYNGGSAFKVVCRDHRGVVVTLIADNYFGYSKKEIKSQISYSANLVGGTEEEHAGGALAFPTYNLGEFFERDARIRGQGHSFDEVVARYGERMTLHPEGYGVDRNHPGLVYVPADARMDLHGQCVHWVRDGVRQEIKLLTDYTYMLPCGYKVRLEPHPHAPTWRLIGTEAEGSFCHKPSTVSGGGKSEISKSLVGAIISGPLYVGDITADLDQVEAIFQRDYGDRFGDGVEVDDRPLLSPGRSLGSVIRLLTPSATHYTPAYNAWLQSIPQHIRALVFIIKRFYRPEWGEDWRRHFTVDLVNGYPGHELKYDGRRLVASYLRVGTGDDKAWRVFKLRQDYVPADKVQLEDDITVSVTLDAAGLGDLGAGRGGGSVKLVENCEQRLFQRPDDAVIRGADLQTETDLAGPDNFVSNFEPLSPADARELVEYAVDLSCFSAPMQKLIRRVARQEDESYFVSSAHPRIVNGRPSPNPRYLQVRPDLARPVDRYVAEMGMRLHRRLPPEAPLHWPVDAVLMGRRNNPPDRARGIRPLAVYNPIHYQELPELFMDLVASLTGKSPSTTGAGSEGALTKGPFNSLTPTADLNTALAAMILAGHHGFSTPAGHIGPRRRVDHDISLLVPEIWCRIPPAEREPGFLIAQGYLEKIDDYVHAGRRIPAGRLGYRITDRFAHAYFGKIFDSPTAVFDEAMLRPETQDPEGFADGVENIAEAQRRVAQGYLDDGSVDDACPPLKALLHIMAAGQYQGMTLDDPAFRGLFTREALLASDWYQERLALQQQRDSALWGRKVNALRAAVERMGPEPTPGFDLAARLAEAEGWLARVRSPEYRRSLEGSLGADWLHREPVSAAKRARESALAMEEG